MVLCIYLSAEERNKGGYMLVILGITGLIIILWPVLGAGIASLFNGIIVLISLPIYWIARIVKRPHNEEEDNKLIRVTSAIALCMVIICFFTLMILQSISN